MAATPFITEDDVKDFTDPAGSSGASYGVGLVTTATISAVCEAMEQNLRRPIVARTITKSFDGSGSRLRLPHVAPGVLTVSSVVENGQPLSEGTDYLVYPDEGCLVRLSGARAPGKWAEGLQTVTVTFTAGVAADTASVPENLKLCAKIAVKFFAHMGWEDYGKRVEAGAWIKPDQFPRQCLWLMDPYRVVVA